MKFTCERCGKRYASTQAPAPGKLYRLRCKACGNLITVRGPDGAAPSEPPRARGEAAAPAPVAAEARARSGAGAARAPTPVPAPSPATAAAPPTAPEPTPQGGYVDLFADAEASGRVRGGGEPPGSLAPSAPAAQGEVATVEGAPSAIDAAPPAASLAAEPVLRPEPPRPVPSIPALSQRPGGPPLALIGAGVAVLLGILVFVLWGPGRKGPAPAPPAIAVKVPAAPAAEAPAPPAAPPAAAPGPSAAAATPSAAAPEPSAAAAAPSAGSPAPQAVRAEPIPPEAPRAEVTPPAPAPARPASAATPAAPAAPAKPAAAERSAREKERERRARADAAAKQRSAAAKSAAQAAGARPAAAEDGGEEEAPPARLAKDQIDSVLQKGRPALDACLERVRGQGLQGRTVLLSFTIRQNGEVAYPTLDDVTLSGSETGSCLKSAARGLQFPKFEGDPEHVQVPLRLP